MQRDSLDEDGVEIEILPNEALASAQAVRAEKLSALMDRRAARSMVVPTLEKHVHAGLREFGLPICLFGEDLHDKRERLRAALATRELRHKEHTSDVAADKQKVTKEGSEQRSENDSEKEDDEEYYTEGSAALRQLRIAIAWPILARARKRLEDERNLRLSDHMHNGAKIAAQEAEAKVVEFVRNSTLQASQIGDSRPLSSISISTSPFSQDDSEWIVATGSWSGGVKIWGDGTNATLLQTVLVHKARISSVSIPREYPDMLLTSSADKTANIFMLNDNAKERGKAVKTQEKNEVFRHLLTLTGHSQRVTDCKAHPVKKSLVLTCSFDGSFILFDEGRTILNQKTGHNGVYRMSFHSDGGLLATCGLEGGIRLWDLRSGRAVMTMVKAHVGATTCLDFSGDGLLLASGGGDNQVKIWDLRKKRCSRSIPAHMGLVSSLRFTGGTSDALLSASFDHTVKIWSARRGWALLKAFTGHVDKVTAVDCMGNSPWFVSSCYDKTWKIWGCSDQGY